MRKNLLSMFLVAISVATLMVSCSDYDNDFTASEISYRVNFEKAFGDVDPNQDWNIASLATITVNTSSACDVRIYAKRTDGTYQIVGDFADVQGTKTLTFDVVEGTTDLLVTNGTSSVYTKVGETVTLGANTRATYPATADGINKAGVTIGDYVEFDLDKYLKNVVATDGILPEENANLGKVVQNFSYLSNGPFTIYPIYWNSSSSHVLGVYWKEGNTYHYQDVYEDMDATGAELAQGNTTYSDKCTDAFPVTVGMTCDAGHVISYIDLYNNRYYELPESQYTEEDCYYPYQSGLWGQVGATCDHGFKITTAGSVEGNTPQKHLNTRKQCSDSFNNSVHVGDVCPNGHTIAYIDSYNNRYQTVNTTYTGVGATAPTEGKVYSKGITINLPVGTQFGFYMKVKTNKTNYTHTLYSQGELNVAKKGSFFDTTNFLTVAGCKVVVDGLNTEKSNAWAATFQTEVNEQTVQYLCFEDWSSNLTDLNDLVFAIPVTDGTPPPPSIVDEEAQTWVICAEDLGDTFDLDYNDVVVEVNHVSGKEKATITPVAAGGTLASYIYFNNGSQDKCLGEIHELLGQSKVNSGLYEPFNVEGNVNTAYCKNIEVTVSADWTIASSTVGDAAFDAATGKAMGGFHMKVVPSGMASTESNATVNGQLIQNSFGSGTSNIPYMFCVPRDWSRIEGTTKYSSWFRWSKELTPMSTLEGYDTPSYNTTGHSFAEWVNDHTAATDWYKYPVLNKTMGIKGITETAVESEENNPSIDPTPQTPESTPTSLTITKSGYNTWTCGECCYLVKGDKSLLKNGATLTFSLVETYTNLNIDLGTSYGAKDIKSGIISLTYIIEDATKYTIDGDTFSFYMTTWGGGDDTVTGVTIK